MTQVYMRATYRDAPVEIMAGWAPMESQVFVKVALLDDEGEWREDIEPVLDVWKEIDVRPTEITVAAPLAEEIRFMLLPLKIDVPDMMLGEIAAHIVLDLGNVRVRYTQDGTRTVISGGVPGYDPECVE